MTKQLVDDYTQLRIKDIQDRLSGEESVVKVLWQSDGERHPVELTSTPCHFGGSRPWLICPICSKRAGVLYDVDGIGCRTCHHLVYRSQREDRAAGARRRAWKNRARLGTSMALGGPIERPRWMHLKTFERARGRILKAERDELREIDRWMASVC